MSLCSIGEAVHLLALVINPFAGGILLFPASYIFGDVLTEVYGYARSGQIIWAGLFSNVLMAVFIWVTIKLPPANGWPFQEQFATALQNILT